MILYLVRHAEKEREGENPPLTKNGIRQAKYLAKKLGKIKFDKFYSSDTNRTKQTSEIVSKKIKMKPKIEKTFNEYEAEDIKKKFSKWKKNEKKRVQEMYKVLDKIFTKQEKEETILIVAHGITNRIIASYLLELNLDKMIRLRQHETCINLIKWSDKWKNWQLDKWNEQTHIPKRYKTKWVKQE
ncbi:MAG TPA: histidine phosphatase family protein [Candidatus Nanoarchaeia archaeon]|nr:histidine phosphatase family protein [Candidatus Nanoarchaeia archaeon]